MTDSIERRLIAAGGATRKSLATAIMLSFGGGMATIVQAVLLARIVTDVVLYHASWTSLSQDLIGLVGFFFLRSVLTYGAEVAAYHAAAAAKVSLRKSLLQHVFRLGPAYLANERSGELAASLLDGIETLEPFLARYLPQMALVVMLPLAILAVVFRLDLISGLVLLVSGPIIPLFMVLVGHQAEAINRRQWRKLLSMSAHFLDAVQGITTLKLFGRVRDEVELITRISDDYRRTTMASLRVAFLTSAVLEFFTSLSIALAAVLFGARLIHGDIGFFPAFLVLLLVPEFFLPLRALATHYHARMSALAAAQRAFEVLDAECPMRWGTALPPPGPLSIVCDSISIEYRKGAYALRDVNVVFHPGSVTAIVGRTGAGKSSLVAAILGFIVPSAGRLLIGNILPLTSVDRDAWWRLIAYVPQSPRLFAGTLAENLRLARRDADATAIRNALARARLSDDVDAMPLGIETMIGTAGSGLSAGQVQRLALARAFLKDAPILILDEATAHLDLETEAEIVETIAELARGRTSIMIAHRLATVHRADRILVLDGGRIVESGNHSALMARGGAYTRLLNIKSRGATACAT